jgi:DNA-binding XRE family transcriptional regulator
LHNILVSITQPTVVKYNPQHKPLAMDSIKQKKADPCQPIPGQLSVCPTPSCTGQLLRLLRQCRGFKQSVLAKRLGVSQQALSKLENAPQVPGERVTAILSLLGCTADDLENIRRLGPLAGH